jgi:hypothetical protein
MSASLEGRITPQSCGATPPRNEIAWVVYTAYSFFISSSEISANYVSSLLAENQSAPNQQTSNNNARYQIAIYSQGFRLSS